MKPSFWKWRNTDTAQCLPTFFVRWRPKGFGVGWLVWAFEVRFDRQFYPTVTIGQGAPAGIAEYPWATERQFAARFCLHGIVDTGLCDKCAAQKEKDNA